MSRLSPARFMAAAATGLVAGGLLVSVINGVGVTGLDGLTGVTLSVVLGGLIAGMLLIPASTSEVVPPGMRSEPCPSCGGSVYHEWRLCPHCGSRLHEG